VQRRVIEKEMSDLKTLRESDEHEVEHCFIDMALNELQERIEMMNQKPSSPIMSSPSEESEKCPGTSGRSSPEDEVIRRDFCLFLPLSTLFFFKVLENFNSK